MTRLPTGTVTFLFTDVEGSTRLWEQHPRAAREALAQHDALIEFLTEQHRGHVVRPRGEGDSRFCVFARASDAVHAAAAIQRALAAEKWPTPSPVHVRMALHTGEVAVQGSGEAGGRQDGDAADLRDGDYYGSAVNRCARLRGIAHGGQTLVSQATADLARDSLHGDLGLRDLGEHRLKDLTAPERVYQLAHPDLTDAFPPLRSLDATPNNLPPQLTSFVGREAELGEVKALVGSTRLVTLTGTGGAGKTRLALQVAAELTEQFPDGVWFVELAPIADAGLVPQVTLAAVGGREVPGRSPVDLLVAELSERRSLIILDNCEHLVDAAARLAEALVRRCSRVKMLATSRELLGVAGETAWRVPSLPAPPPTAVAPDVAGSYPAAALFVERARLVRPEFSLTAENAPAVTQIVRRLDGIPLAIELAAARVRVLAVEQIAERLDDRFRLLTGGSRTALRRQQTLQALVDWSYDLLPEPERALLRRLSVFAGGFSLDAAEEVAGGDVGAAGDVLDLLGHLVDKSLVIAEGRGGAERYQLLETIRQYAGDKLLAAGEAQAARDRHLAWCVEFVRRAASLPGTIEGLESRFVQLEIEIDNVRAAVEWATGTNGHSSEALELAALASLHLHSRGSVGESREWLARALALPGGEPRLRATALRQAAFMEWRFGTTSGARDMYRQAAEMARSLDDSDLLALSLASLGYVLADMGDFEAGLSLLEDALVVARARAGQDPGQLALLLGVLGWVRHRGDRALAIPPLEEGLALARSIGLTGRVANILSWLAAARIVQGDHIAARDLLVESRDRAARVGSRPVVAFTDLVAGDLARVQGRQDDARGLYLTSLEQYRGVGELRHVPWVLEGLAGVEASDQPVRAATLLGAAAAQRERMSIPLPPTFASRHAADLRSVRAGAGADFERAWSLGAAMSLDQAIEYALSGRR